MLYRFWWIWSISTNQWDSENVLTKCCWSGKAANRANVLLAHSTVLLLEKTWSRLPNTWWKFYRVLRKMHVKETSMSSLIHTINLYFISTCCPQESTFYNEMQQWQKSFLSMFFVNVALLFISSLGTNVYIEYLYINVYLWIFYCIKYILKDVKFYGVVNVHDVPPYFCISKWMHPLYLNFLSCKSL